MSRGLDLKQSIGLFPSLKVMKHFTTHNIIHSAYCTMLYNGSHRFVYLWLYSKDKWQSFFQLQPVVASSLKAMEPSPPLSTPAFTLLPSTASGPSRFATLLPLTAPPTWNPSAHFLLLLSLPWEQCWGSTIEAKLFSTSSIFICQTAVAAAALAELQCFVCWFCLLVCMLLCVHVCLCVCVCVRTACLGVLQLVRLHLHGIQMHVFVCRWRSDTHGKQGCYEPITSSSVLQVAAGKKVRLKFNMFRMKEPGVDIRVCHKDYVEVMGTK